LGAIAREQKQAEDRALVARYLAKVADRQRPAQKRKAEPIQIPPIPKAWRDAMSAGLYL
jgi:hypothetical protein